MSSEESNLPIINKEKPLTANKSVNLIQTINIQSNKISTKLIKKINNTSRSISIKKANTNISNESERLKNKSSNKKKNTKLNIKIKSSFRNYSTKDNFILFKKMYILSSPEEKSNTKSKKKL